MLEVHELSFGYTDTRLFDGVTFRLNAGERGCIVAPNGAGKSTLLAVIAGELHPDRGAVVIQKGMKLGYYRQSHDWQFDGTLLDAMLDGFGDLVELRHELQRAQRQASTGSDEALKALSDAMDRYQAAGADALEHRVQKVATELGFSPNDFDRDVATLSGGERGRLSLGAVLAGEPDLLLLDEPTNHLDLRTIRWLESVLSGWRGAVLVVSHDRAFLDNACPITMELGQRSFRAYPLPYSAYHAARAEDLERERKLAEEQQAMVARTEEYIRQNIAGQKTKQAQSRRKMLEKLERIDRPEDVWQRAERIRFRFVEAPRSGDIVLDAAGLGAERGRPLFSALDLLVRRGDRVGIVGPNGCGKSTLLRLLAGQGAPDDLGSIKRGTNLKDGFFDQHLGALREDASGLDEIQGVRGDLNTDAARQYLARFRFYGDDPFRKVGSLSGGERTRLALAKLLLEPRNLLFLDEPTNHLDIVATEILEQALVDFEGTVVLVSHDRRFLETVTTRTVSFEPDRVIVHEGSFGDYVDSQERRTRAEQEQRRELEARAERDRAKGQAGKKPNSADPNDAAAEHRARRAQAREREKKQKRLKELEDLVAAGERELGSLRQKLNDAPGGNWEELHAWATKERSLTERVEKMMSEWLALSEELANIAAEAGGEQ